MKFFDTNEEEITKFTCRNFDGLEAFYETREQILAIIHEIDDLIEQENKNLAPEKTISETERLSVQQLMQEKEELVKAILGQDLNILSCVEKEKSQIIVDLQKTKHAHKAVGAYHSGSKKNQLDEEA